jgi:formylglycine-generating enzyme required for sulfatase activity
MQPTRFRAAIALVQVSLPLLVGAASPERVPKRPAADEQRACAEAMALVDGEYCPRVRQSCLSWMEKPSLAGDGRCERFASSECLSPRVAMRFCIDEDEYVRPGEVLPMNAASWSDARRICESGGKRLCLEKEWNFACEGEEMLPYPTGLERDPVRCNFDRMDLIDSSGRPRDLRLPPSRVAGCASPFDVRSLVGNVDEWVVRDVTWGPWQSALKGGWWLPGRNRCRPATTAHDEHYRDFQTGFRCCADAPLR